MQRLDTYSTRFQCNLRVSLPPHGVRASTLSKHGHHNKQVLCRAHSTAAAAAAAARFEVTVLQSCNSARFQKQHSSVYPFSRNVRAGALPAHKQQQPPSDAPADDSWYTGSPETSSSSSSSNNSSSSAGKDGMSSSSSKVRSKGATTARGRFRRAGSAGGAAARKPAASRRTASPLAAEEATTSQPAAAAAAPPQRGGLQDESQQDRKQQQQPTEPCILDSSSSSSSAAVPVVSLSSQLPPSQVSQLRRYLDHMLEVNKSMNLTAIRDPAEAWQRHIEDSLALLPVIEQYADSSSGGGGSSSGGRRASLSLIDVGTGAGLPGMVLAVVRPDWQVTLLDSLRKRCDFLQATAAMLGLVNVTVVWSRAEDGGRRQDLRDGYDVAVARAVADMRLLAELCLPFVRPGGTWLAAKGANPEDEVSAARTALSKLQGKLVAVPRVQSWAPEGQRTAVVVTKTGPTPQQFPRPPGTPAKKPL